MKSMVKRILAMMLSFAMVFTSMIGLDMPVYADDLPTIDVYSFDVSPSNLESKGGNVNIEIKSFDWPDGDGIVYYTVKNKKTGDMLADSAEATVSKSNPIITVAIPQNETADEVQYLIKASSSSFMGNVTGKNVTVAGQTGGPGESEQQTDKFFKAKVLDENEQPVSGVSFKMYSYDYDYACYTPQTDANGCFKLEGSNYIDSELTFSLDSEDYDYTDADTVELKYVSGNYECVKYNRTAYDGTEKIIHVTSKEETPEQPDETESKIVSISYDKTELTAEGGMVTVTIRGTGLTEMGISSGNVYCNGAVDFSIFPEVEEESDEEITLVFKISENSTGQEKVYNFVPTNSYWDEFNIDDVEGKNQIITVAPKATEPEEPVLPAIGIFSFDVTPATMDCKGGDAKVTINGDWPSGATEGKVYCQVKVVGGETLLDVTEKHITKADPSFTVALPENTGDSDVTYSFKVNDTTNMMNLSSKKVTVEAPKATEPEEPVLPAIDIFSFDVTPATMDCKGGEAKVTINGDWPSGATEGKVYCQVKVVGGETLLDVTEKHITKADPSFTVALPENTGDSDVTYSFKVNDTTNMMNLTPKKVIVEAPKATEPEEPEVTIKDLRDLVNDVDNLDKDLYTEESWEALQNVLDEYYSILGLYNPDPEAIAEAYKAISEAKDALVEKPESVATITSVKVSPAELPANGGKIKIEVEGENLTADNWGVNLTAKFEGIDKEAKTRPWKYEEITDKGATIVVPRNITKNKLEYTVAAGPITSIADGAEKEDVVIDSQATAKFTIEKKAYSTKDIYPTSAQMESDNSVLVAFDCNLELMADVKEMLPMFGLWDSAKNSIACEATDLVVNGNTVLVTFKDAVPAEAASIAIEEGTFKLATDAAGNVTANADTFYVITKKPVINSVEFDKTMLDSKGGTVTATLGGYKVEDIELKDAKGNDNITAKILKAGVSKPTEITPVITKEEGKAPVVTFDLPANTSDKTETYMLKISLGGLELKFETDSRASVNTISVLPEGKTASDTTLGAMTITAMSGDNGGDLSHATAQVKTAVGELKTEVRLYGTNLTKKTKIRAIDENGVEWPVYDIPECDGVWRFVAVAGPDKNGLFGEGNSQIIELLPPRYAGTNKTYTIQASIDGKTWLEDPVVTLTVNNENISGEGDFRDCTDKNFKTVTVKYVDERGREIAPADTYKGYTISMVQQFNIKAKEIVGYNVVSEPDFDTWVGDNGRTYTYKYAANGEPTFKVSASAKSYYYNGKSKSPALTVKDADGNVLTEGTDYTVEGTRKATKPGTYKMTVCGIGEHTGYADVTYKIAVKPTSIKKLKKGKKKFTVKVAKQSSSYVTGYQVRYSLKKSMKSSKTKTIGTKYSATSKTIKKLKAKKYYVQVRSYKKISGKKYYSSWSKVKSVKVKK